VTFAAIAGAAVAGVAGIAGSAISGGMASDAAGQGIEAQMLANQRAIMYGQQALGNSNSMLQPIRDRGDAGYWGLQNAINQSDANTRYMDSMMNPYLMGGQQAIGGVNQAIGRNYGIFDQVQAGMNPYLQAGQQGVMGQQSLLAGGPTQFNRMTPDQIMAGPEYQAMIREGENALLQNASATGGLRGGDTQNALANFRQNTLAQLIGTEFDRGMQTANFNEGARMNQMGGYGNLAQGGMNANQYIGQLGNATTGNALQGYGGLINSGLGAAGVMNDAQRANIATRMGIWGDVYGAGLNATNNMVNGQWKLADIAGGASQNQGAATAAGLWGQAQANGQMVNGIAGGVGMLAGSVPWGKVFGTQPAQTTGGNFNYG
jgi:hypothetical protein